MSLIKRWTGAVLGLVTLLGGVSRLAAEPLFLTRTTPPPVRVVAVHDALASEAFAPRPERLRPLVDRGLLRLTGQTNLARAWGSLLSTSDVVGIKVYAAPGPNSGTRPAVAAAVVDSLLAAGLPRTNILLWDKRWADLRLSGYVDLAGRLGVRVASCDRTEFERTNAYDSAVLGNLVHGDLEYGNKDISAGRKSHVTTLLTREVTKVINLPPLLNHNETGVAGCLTSLALGSVDNTLRFENHADRLAVAVPELYALPALSERVALNIMDALICQYQGGERTLLHYSAVLNQLWLGRDPVAMDVLALNELARQRQLAGIPPAVSRQDLYDNAALMELGVANLKSIRLEAEP